MPSVCFYFQVHQPYRIKHYPIFSIGEDHQYFNSTQDRLDNEMVLRKVLRKSYLPATQTILKLLQDNPDFKASFSFSGVVLDQFLAYAPEIIDLFRAAVHTGRVELLDETYYHSLAFLYSRDEFKRQVALHRAKIKELFDYEPRIFRNTELSYNNEIGKLAEEMGYDAVLAEGVDWILGWRNPNFVYKVEGADHIKLLLKNYRLSDDVAFRFSQRSWEGWPLTAEKFAHWISSVNGNGETVNLFMDYETFGEHQWEDTGIFEFLRHLPEMILRNPDNNFKTPSEVIDAYEPRGSIDFNYLSSWADIERDLSAWLGNTMQSKAMASVYALEQPVLASGDKRLIADWRKLQTSDHFYYMSTKWFQDGDVHKYFNPYETPYDAFINYMNVLSDMEYRLSIEVPAEHALMPQWASGSAV